MNELTVEEIHELAIQAGAAKFYPGHQSKPLKDGEEPVNYIISSGFLERFAKLIYDKKS
jgi:hypothetical protein